MDCSLDNPGGFSVRVRVRVTLQLTVSQSVHLGVEPDLGLLTRDIFFFWKVTVLSFGGALSDERSGLSFVSLQSVSIYTKYLHTMLHIIDIYNIYSALDTFTIRENKIQYVQYT
jgi:hypothetical protein